MNRQRTRVALASFLTLSFAACGTPAKAVNDAEPAAGDGVPPVTNVDVAPTPPPTSAPTTEPARTAEPVVPAPKTSQGPFPISTDPKLKNPKAANEKAPKTFKAKFETTAGDFVIECNRSWGPNGVDRIYNLVKIGFYDDAALFRVVQTPRPFVVQFGIHSDPKVSEAWSSANLPKDDVKESNTRGTVTFAMAGSPDTRSTQLFINYGDNANLDKLGFAPLCKVQGDGMDVVDRLFSEYGERPSNKQGQIQALGNAYLRETFPELDYIKTARIVTDESPAKSPGQVPKNATPPAR